MAALLCANLMPNLQVLKEMCGRKTSRNCLKDPSMFPNLFIPLLCHIYVSPSLSTDGKAGLLWKGVFLWNGFMHLRRVFITDHSLAVWFINGFILQSIIWLDERDAGQRHICCVELFYLPQSRRVGHLCLPKPGSSYLGSPVEKFKIGELQSTILRSVI